MLGKDFFLRSLIIYRDDKKKFSVFFSQVKKLQKIKGVLSVEEKMNCLNQENIRLNDFFEKWFYFFSTRHSQQLLSGLRYTYTSYGYSEIDKNIQEVVSFIEGTFQSVKKDAYQYSLREKLKYILNKIKIEEIKIMWFVLIYLENV